MRFPFCTVLLWLALAAPAFAQRIDQTLPDGWQFIERDVPLTAPTDAWPAVTVPHTWNNLDGQAGTKANPGLKYGYYRGACWYARALAIKPEWKNKRVFLRFEAASTVAQVYLNGQLLGEHRGGFTAFCFELTGKLRFDGPNELRVRVDNSPAEDVPPLSGDFNVEGGIYRPVHLIVTDPVCISPLDSGSPGIYLDEKFLDNGQVAVNVRTILSKGGTGRTRAQLTAELDDAGGKFLKRIDEFMYLDPGQTRPPPEFLLFDHPHLWNGRKDPYLYRVKVRVSGQGYDDEVTQPLGLRTVAITNEEGFLLNGKPYPIHGVNLHQDMRDEGWAMSDADHERDMKLMLDMGVTAIRLAHYPQSEKIHELADRNGILLWDEIPLVNQVRDTPEFKASAEQQLREMILQRYNHPSAAFWGLFNELDPKVDGIAVPLLEELKREQLQLDASRISVSASNHARSGFDRVPDCICFNAYFGWYSGRPEELGRYIDERYHENGDRRIGLSEYGAGANGEQHQDVPLTEPKPAGPFHPEEWQAYVHERDWAQISGNPKLWGSFIWCMFDFACAGRDEGGQPALNDKGMVTADRKIRKDVYYFYQANWSDEPMLHIAGHRFVERHQPVTNVTVYSNGATVELTVNGRSLGARTPDAVHVCRWNGVNLVPGRNVLAAKVPGTPLADDCTWDFSADPP